MKTKKVFKYFTIFEYEKEANYLRRMHQSGWKFVKVSGFGVYHFQQCPPEDVIYQLDYNQEGVAHKEEYVKMFNDCGWEYLQDYVGYSYFRKPASQAAQDEGIFCDDDSRRQMMQRVYEGRIRPLVMIFGCILIPQFLNSVVRKSLYLAIPLLLCIVLYVYIFIRFSIQYWQLKRRN